jgi:hypothetical protein
MNLKWFQFSSFRADLKAFKDVAVTVDSGYSTDLLLLENMNVIFVMSCTVSWKVSII